MQSIPEAVPQPKHGGILYWKTTSHPGSTTSRQDDVSVSPPVGRSYGHTPSTNSCEPGEQQHQQHQQLFQTGKDSTQ